MSTTLRPPADAIAVDGFAVLGSVIEGEDLDCARAAFDRAILDGTPSAYGVIALDAWRVEPALTATVRRVGALVADVLDAAVSLFQETLIAKVAGAEEIPWHQDYSYWPLDRPHGLTTWMALDDADEDNGCLRYSPGSHRLGERRASWGLAGDDVRARLPQLVGALEAPEVTVALHSGSAVAHHPLLAHRSGPNRTARVRRAWSAFWVTDDVRWDPTHAPHASTAVDPPPVGAPHVGALRFVPTPDGRAAARDRRTPSPTAR